MEQRKFIGLKRNLLGLVLLSSLSFAQAKDTLVYCSPAAVEGFDPSLSSGADTQDAAARTIFNRLVELHPKTDDILPSLAERYDVSEDGLVYTFYLKPKVKFQANKLFKPSRDFNADDVIFSYQRMLDPENFFAKAHPQTYLALGSTDFKKSIKKIEKVDDLTVKFTLNHIDSSFIFEVATSGMSIQSEEYAKFAVAEKKPLLLEQQPIGTGPFILVNHQKDSAIRYQANPDYFLGEPSIKKLVFLIAPESIVRVQKIQAGECDLIAYPPLVSLNELRKNTSLKIDEVAGMSLGYMYLNTEKFPPLADARVRNALSYAVDRDVIVKDIFLGSATAAGNFVPPTSALHDASIKVKPYDLEKAKALLTEAGFKDGFSMELWAIPVQRAAQPNGKKLAEILQQDWAKIGVKAEIKSADWAEYLKIARSGAYKGVTTMGAGSAPVPDAFVKWLRCDFIGQSNFSQWCNPKYDELLIKAKAAKTVAERDDLYHQAQRMIADESPIIPIAYPTNYVVYKNKIRNFEIRADGAIYFEKVSFDD